MFVTLFPDLFDAACLSHLGDPEGGNTRGNANLIIEGSVLCQDLEDVKVFSFLHNVDVFLMEAMDKRKTNSHRELSSTTLIGQIYCLLFLWSERMGNSL